MRIGKPGSLNVHNRRRARAVIVCGIEHIMHSCKAGRHSTSRRSRHCVRAGWHKRSVTAPSPRIVHLLVCQPVTIAMQQLMQPMQCAAHGTPFWAGQHLVAATYVQLLRMSQLGRPVMLLNNLPGSDHNGLSCIESIGTLCYLSRLV
jgi:hypothetical protein